MLFAIVFRVEILREGNEKWKYVLKMTGVKIVFDRLRIFSVNLCMCLF